MLMNKSLRFVPLPGVFSQNHLDVGTAVLLPYLNQVKSGRIADFGCGAGIISCYLAKINSSNIIHALDIDAFALRSTEMTFSRNGIGSDQLRLQPVTGIADAPTELDAIVSNPLFIRVFIPTMMQVKDSARTLKTFKGIR